MLLIHCCENDYMKLNTDKCYLIVLGYKHEKVRANIGKDLIWENNINKSPRITFDRDLKLDKYVLKVCNKVNQKLDALSRMANFFQ